MVEKANNTPPWFNEALKNQNVSKEILFHFEKHYLTPNEMEEHNEEL